MTPGLAVLVLLGLSLGIFEAQPTTLISTALLLIALTVMALWLMYHIDSTERRRFLDSLVSRLHGAQDSIGEGDPGFTELESLDQALAEIRRSFVRAQLEVRQARKELDTERADTEQQVQRRTAALAAREESVRLLLESVPEAIYGVDSDGVCTFCNPACVKLLAYQSESDLIGKPISEIMPTPVWHTVQTARQGKPIHLPEKTFWRADGSLFSVEYWSFPILKQNQVVGAVITFIDISERKKAEAALFREKEHAQVTLQAIADGVITTGADDRVRYLNPAAEALLGWSDRDARGKHLQTVFPVEPGTAVDPQGNSCADPASSDGCEQPVLLLNRGGTKMYIERSSAEIHDRDGTAIGHIIVFRDVSDSRRMAQQLTYQATHDPLTGAINRREFEARVERLLTVKDGRSGCAVCYLDLDQFKVVNDTCGHSAGDELLRQISQLLQSHLRQRDTLARLGGDEFGVLLEHCALADAFRIATAIREAVHEFRFAWDDKTFSLGVSIGLVELDSVGGGISEVLSAADTACYMAKEKGRNRVQIHHPEDREVKQIRREINWLSQINAALEKDQFRLFYQDIVDTSKSVESELGRHIEILVRMVDTDGKLALPGAFLPAAERYNVIQATDRWIVRRVFDWLSAPGRGRLPETVSINLSGPTISDPTFLDFVLDVLTQTGVPPQRVCFEITETAAIAKLSTATTLIRNLKQRGFFFALDDFGSGLASFGYLQSLPVDFVKIDGSFIRGIANDPINRAMVRSINDIGHIMGKKTIAEYVEDEATLRTLRGMGVDFAQGYGISRPRPIERLDGSLRLVAS